MPGPCGYRGRPEEVSCNISKSQEVKHIRRNLFQISVFPSPSNDHIRVDQPEYSPVHFNSLGWFFWCRSMGFEKFTLLWKAATNEGISGYDPLNYWWVPAQEISHCPVASGRHKFCLHEVSTSSQCAVLHCPNQTYAGHKEMSGASLASSATENDISAGYLMRKIILRLSGVVKSKLFSDPTQRYIFTLYYFIIYIYIIYIYLHLSYGHAPLSPFALCFAQLEQSLLSYALSVTCSLGWSTVILSCRSQARQLSYRFVMVKKDRVVPILISLFTHGQRNIMSRMNF